jgi:hypothetical protein
LRSKEFLLLFYKIESSMKIVVLFMMLCFMAPCHQGEHEIWLHEMDLHDIEMGWPIPPHINETVAGTPLTVGGVVYERGVWTHSYCEIPIVLHKNGVTFEAYCGADDITLGSYESFMEFLVVTDKDTVFRSGPVRSGMDAQRINVSLVGVDTLRLVLRDTDSRTGNDHGDWLEAKIKYKGKTVPFVHYNKVKEEDMERPSEGYSSFHPGKSWYDTDGNKIQAHGGGILKVGDTYYWYGEHKGGKTTFRPKSRVDVIGVSCYSSKDLYNWKYEGLALPATPNDTTSPLHPSNVLERPKVVYNPNTKKYVMWVKNEDAGYTWNKAMRAVSDHPTGPFSVVLNEKPDGLRFGDFALYEENGAGYMIWGSHDTHSVFIYSLKPDFVHIDKRLAVIYQGEKREAPAIIKLGQRYLLFTSGKSGWSPNPCHYAWANDVAGPWTKMGEFAVGTGRETTFRSQSTELIEHDGTLIYMGDRWNQRDLGDSRYIWLPLLIKGDSVRMEWLDKWDY